jgi:ribosomal protein S18 acetylase RimI-like enzyme
MIDTRPATTQDATLISMLNADVQQVHADALPFRFKPPGPETFTPAEAEALLSRADHVAFLAYVDEAPAGYLLAEIVRRAETTRLFAQDMIYVHHISVRPAVRQRGVGRALMDAVKARGKADGISLLALDAWTFNEGALSFFRRYGLVPYNIRFWSKTD